MYSNVNREAEKVELDDPYDTPEDSTSDIEKQLAQTKFKLGMEYSQNGKKEEALKELDEALLLDTENFLIRKQRWYIRNPEKFSPTIDIEWQQQQLEKEKAEEAQLKGDLVCGTEGCEIPGTTNDNKESEEVPDPHCVNTLTRRGSGTLGTFLFKPTLFLEAGDRFNSVGNL